MNTLKLNLIWRMLAAFILVVLFGLLGTSNSYAAWTTQSKAYDKSSKQWGAMFDQLNAMNSLYANADSNVYWNDVAIVSRWEKFVGSWDAYQQALEDFRKEAAQTVSAKSKTTATAIAAVTPKACLSKAARTKVSSVLTAARSARTIGVNLYKRTSSDYAKSESEQAKAGVLVSHFSKKAVAKQKTDGYYDNEVYQFGSHQLIDMPKASTTGFIPYDPEPMQGLTNALGWADYYSVPFLESDFVSPLNNALSKANLAKNLNHC